MTHVRVAWNFLDGLPSPSSGSEWPSGNGAVFKKIEGTSVQQVIGLIGGMSWESSAEYYRIINQAVRARLGGVHSARVLM